MHAQFRIDVKQRDQAHSYKNIIRLKNNPTQKKTNPLNFYKREI